MNTNPKIFISTYPFGKHDKTPIKMLEQTGWDFVINPYKTKLKSEQLKEIIKNYDALIAGTEKIDKDVLDKAKNLKIISRVGIGLDNIDLKSAKERGIETAYTPDAPTKAVSELTLGLILNLYRNITKAHNNLKNDIWERLQGERIENKTIGIIGVGRIGKEVIKLLSPFNTNIIANDINPDENFGINYNVKWQTKKEIYKQADILTLHIPLTPITKNLITKTEFSLMKKECILINTARGGIVNEQNLYFALKENVIAGAGFDVFVQEPYKGNLLELENIILTPHIGSCSLDCRRKMETEAAKAVIDFFNGDSVNNIVPEIEYEYQNKSLSLHCL